MQNDNTLFVSAFYANMNDRYQNSIDVYLKHAMNVLQDASLDKIIFTDVPTYNCILTHYKKELNIDMSMFYIARPFNPNLLALIDPAIMLQEVVTCSPAKDTASYMLLMCNKTEFMRSAIQIKGNYKQYIWFDFGLNYILQTPLPTYLHRINDGATESDNKIHIGHIWPLSPAAIDVKSCNKSVCWYFAGGVFGSCSKSQLILFADIMKAYVYEFVVSNKYIVWEVNLWALIYKNHPDLFAPYKCNHDDSIVSKYGAE